MRDRALLWPVGVTLAILVAWEQLVTVLRVKTILLPRPSLIAGVLYRDFASRRDDVVVLVGRERRQATREQGGGLP